MSEYKKYTFASINKDIHSDYYFYSINGQWFSYSFDYRTLFDVCSLHFKTKNLDKAKVVEFDSYKELFYDFQDTVEEVRGKNNIEYFVILTDIEEDEPILVIHCAREYLQFTPVTQELDTITGAVLDLLDGESCQYYKKYKDIRLALEDPIFLDYRDILDRL